MKRCPRCHARFEDDRVVCAYDGAALVEGSDPMLGRVLAERYRLLQRIGAGGMGTVYRAQHLLLRREVALKLLASELTRDPVMRERFLREAQATHMLRHPNIVEVFDVALDGSRVFLVMELLEGDGLASWLGAGPIDVVRTLRVVRPVVAALARAHSLGVVHRDIKPENVFIARQPEGDAVVKVLDFGIAYLRHEARLTAPGEVFGTPEYLAPEIARGEDCVPASDLYAVGVMLFEMVTGTQPFDGDLTQLIAHHRSTPAPSARARNPEIPAELDALIARLLQKDPAARTASAAVLGEQLDAMLDELDPPQRSVRAKLPRPSTPPADDRAPVEETHHATLPRPQATPPSLATLRQRRATFEAAVAAAYPEHAPAWIADALRALNAAMHGLDAIESQRRLALRAMAERTRAQQERREALQDALAEVSDTQARAEVAARAAAAQLADARAREVGVLNEITLAWNDLGPPPSHPGAMDESRAQQMEALGAEAARWRRARADVAAQRAHLVGAEAALESTTRAGEDALSALLALEDEAARDDDTLRSGAAQTAVELDALYAAVQENSDALLSHLGDLPIARGLITWLGPAARSA
jgi:serine/threonine-protein kinase